MNEFQVALLVGAAITAIISWGLPRAFLWITAGALSFILSTAWARYGLPYPAWFTGICDASVCLLVYFFGRLKWEMAFGYLFQCSIILSILYLIGAIESHTAYVIGLEAINWLALLLINATVVTSWLGANGMGAGRYSWGGVRWAERSLYKKRADPPFHKVPQ